MSRIFPNFFDSYQDYFQDTFVPTQFNEWACLSIVAAALERKVWLPWSDSWSCYPNIYVLFVSGPGEGKTQALNNAVDLLEETNRKLGGTINILPNQATEAAFIKLLSQGRSFQVGSKIAFQSAAYYRAAEAQASLKNIFGDFLACLTDLYDCPNKWARATVKDGQPIEIKNICVNLLAATTFNYLAELVNDRNVQGGFASRLIYVLSQKKAVQAQRFQNGGMTQTLRTERNEYRRALVEDLQHIHRMQGPMVAEPEFAAAWEAWFVASEEKRKGTASEVLQSLLVRNNLHMLKTSMLLSACESSDCILRKRHWDRALSLVEPAMKNIPHIFRESRAQSLEGGKIKNIPHAVISVVQKTPGITLVALRNQLQFMGAGLRDIDNITQSMISSGIIGVTQGQVKILRDPDNHL